MERIKSPIGITALYPQLDRLWAALDRHGIELAGLGEHGTMSSMFLTTMIGVAYDDWGMTHREIGQAFLLGRNGNRYAVQSRVSQWKATPEPIRMLLREIVYRCLLRLSQKDATSTQAT